jgi:hypothetical protein
MIKIKDGFVSSFSKFKELNEGDFFVYDNNIYQKTARFSCFFYKEGAVAPGAGRTAASVTFTFKSRLRGYVFGSEISIEVGLARGALYGGYPTRPTEAFMLDSVVRNLLEQRVILDEIRQDQSDELLDEYGY